MNNRCPWPSDNPQMIAYHDTEWGVPVHTDKQLFGKLVLDGFQAGLSWAIILRKRDAFLKAFDGFDPDKMARYDAKRIARILRDPGIVRNKQKVKSAVGNARAYLKLKEAGESFDRFLWQFVGGQPKVNAWKTLKRLPAETKESVAMSKALVERGFRFVGPTIVYAFMQAVGMVNDHLVTCYRYRELTTSRAPGTAPSAGPRAPSRRER
ncbi:MAG TPA: DNA-3-methyladenine glycosylase I [Candidatus Krumholzibacteria bacterium]|nr:DNA-3-methyladenine glycosylase I [Candidatus Krumholzibacteria bacterium]